MRLIWACSGNTFFGKKGIFGFDFFFHFFKYIDLFFKTFLTTEKDTNVRINIFSFLGKIYIVLYL